MHAFATQQTILTHTWCQAHLLPKDLVDSCTFLQGALLHNFSSFLSHEQHESVEGLFHVGFLLLRSRLVARDHPMHTCHDTALVVQHLKSTNQRVVKTLSLSPWGNADTSPQRPVSSLHKYLLLELDGDIGISQDVRVAWCCGHNWYTSRIARVHCTRWGHAVWAAIQRKVGSNQHNMHSGKDNWRM